MASAILIIKMKIKNKTRFIPNKIGMGPQVAIEVPSNIKS